MTESQSMAGRLLLWNILKLDFLSYTPNPQTPTHVLFETTAQNVFSRQEGICCCRENTRALTKLTTCLINYRKPWSLINLLRINTLEWGIDFCRLNFFSVCLCLSRNWSRITFSLLCPYIHTKELQNTCLLLYSSCLRNVYVCLCVCVCTHCKL